MQVLTKTQFLSAYSAVLDAVYGILTELLSLSQRMLTFK